MFKKALILSIVTIALSTLLVPFSISAYTVQAPIIGVNIRALSYDKELFVNRYNVDFDNSQTRWQCQSSHSTMGCQVWESIKNNTVQDSITGYIVSQNTLSETVILYEYEFILDKPYVGYFTINWQNDLYINVYVNGTSGIFRSTTYNTEFRVTNYSLTYAPIETINQSIQWNIADESFGIVCNTLDKNLDIVKFHDFQTFNYPVFSIPNNTNYFSTYITQGIIYDYIFVASENLWNNSLIDTALNLSSYFDFRYVLLERFSILGNNNLSYIYHLKCTAKSSGRIFLTSGQKIDYYIPIYFNREDYPVSTDFALRYDLSNELLDNLNTIANGNTNSNQSSSAADQTNQQAVQTFQQEEQLVNDAENDLQNNLNSLDIQNQNNNLFGNSKFIASASWVKTQFDKLTNNNAFGYLITFSLVIGLSLVIVGKLRS